MKWDLEKAFQYPPPNSSHPQFQKQHFPLATRPHVPQEHPLRTFITPHCYPSTTAQWMYENRMKKNQPGNLNLLCYTAFAPQTCGTISLTRTLRIHMLLLPLVICQACVPASYLIFWYLLLSRALTSGSLELVLFAHSGLFWPIRSQKEGDYQGSSSWTDHLDHLPFRCILLDSSQDSVPWSSRLQEPSLRVDHTRVNHGP